MLVSIYSVQHSPLSFITFITCNEKSKMVDYATVIKMILNFELVKFLKYKMTFYQI